MCAKVVALSAAYEPVLYLGWDKDYQYLRNCIGLPE